MIAPGDVIADRYGVEELIGEGGLAQVWRVRHRDLGSVHALKLLLFRKPRLMERLILEGRIQAQLRHPNIVAVTDVVRHGGQVGLVMEYVDGVPLQSWLEVNQPLAVERALELFAPILAGVRAAHDAGVLHRDLKPANILLARVGRTVVPKVTDFGIAKVVEGSFEGLDTRSGAVMGTPGYLAPEQAVDASTVDRRADLFALGAILYEMLAGRRAFEGCDVSIPKDYELPELQSLRPEIPDVVARAVEKALAWDPADRYPEVGAFAAALLSGRPRLLEIVEGNTGSSEIGTNLGHFAPQDSLQPARDLIRETIEHVPMGANPTVIPSMSRAAETAGGETFGTRDEVSEPAERAAPADMPWARRPDDGAPAPWTSPVTEAPAASWTSPPPLTPGGPPAPIRHRPQRRRLRPAGAAVLAGGLVMAAGLAWWLVSGADVEPLPIPGGPPPAPASANVATNPAIVAGWRGSVQDVAPSEPAMAHKTVGGRAPAPAAAPPVAPEAPPEPPAFEAPEIPAPRVATPPDVRGTWSGQANGRPLELRLVGQEGTVVRGEVTLFDGPSEVRHRVTGTVRADGSIDLRAADSSLVFAGRVDGAAATGHYQPDGTGGRLAWSARHR